MTEPVDLMAALMRSLEPLPECKGQAVCTNGRKCLEASACLRPYQCKRCLRSTDRPARICASCESLMTPSELARCRDD